MFTYITVYVVVTELYALVRIEDIIHKAIDTASEQEKPLVVIHEKGQKPPFRWPMLSLRSVDYMNPTELIPENSVVLDMFTLTNEANIIFQNVHPNNLFCVTYPFWTISAYLKGRLIVLSHPPYQRYIWTTPNPVYTIKEWIRSKILSQILPMIRSYMPGTSTPQ